MVGDLHMRLFEEERVIHMNWWVVVVETCFILCGWWSVVNREPCDVRIYRDNKNRERFVASRVNSQLTE